MPPPLPQPMNKKTAPQPPKPEAPTAPREMILGNLRVGHHGIAFASLEDSGVLPPMVSLDDLVCCRELGKGAAGTVCLYKHKATGERYAVKKINLTGKTGRDTVNATAEIRSVLAAPCPQAVRLFNAYVRDGHLLLLMEYMDGGDLEELLLKQPSLPEGAASYVAAQMLHALTSLHRKNAVIDADKHRKTIHRDIKPANVMLSRNADIKLADFGVAGNADSIGLASFVGTATYMSPERIKGQRYGTESDIWSLGIVVAQMLLGRYPFKGVNGGFMALLKEVTTTQRLVLEPAGSFSAEAQDFVDVCLKQEGKDRATAGSLLEHPWIVRYNGGASPTAGKDEFREIMTSVGISRQQSVTTLPGTPAGAERAAQQAAVAPIAKEAGAGAGGSVA